MKFFKNQRGDTILEVLIVVAVLSLVLTISYSITNRSTQGNRQAQERSEASKNTESQIELLKKYLSQTTSPNLPTSPNNFCMKADGTPTTAISQSIETDAQRENFTAYSSTPELDAACKSNSGGVEYFSYIHREGNTFTSHTRWYKAGGNGVDESTMVHRLYPDLASGGGSGGTTETGCNSPYQTLNPVGGCTPCENGYASPDGVTVNSCQPVPPRIIAEVKKIVPDGNSTPSCDKTVYTDRLGTSVNLSRPGFNQSTTTNASSQAIFDLTRSYIGSTFTLTIASQGNYEVCPSSPQTATATPTYGPAVAQGDVQTYKFKIRPICNIATYKTVDQGYWTYDGPRAVYWWNHEGGGYYYPFPESRMTIYEMGGVVRRDRYGTLYYGTGPKDPNYNRYFYNNWVIRGAIVYDQPVWHPVYVQVFTGNVCPSN